jgi:hypothetical protein
MSLLLVPVAAYLLLYAPGHYTLRCAGRGEHGSRLFREVLLSACCTSWVGFVLAELRLYSLPALFICQALIAAAAALSSRQQRPTPYDWGDLAGVTVAVVSWLVLAPPLDTRILGSDSAGYLAAGVHLSRHGSLVIHDPTMPLLPAELKLVLFPGLGPTPWAPPYLRLPGSLVLRGLDTNEVLPAFHHLITVWIAVFHGLAGSVAAQWVITLFAGLSVWAMVQFAASMGGRWTAAAFFILLSLSAVQSWYSRFLMPEIPAQFFIWGGLSCLSFFCTTRRRADAALAGLAFGIAGLMRLENAAFLLAALLAGTALGNGGWRDHRWWLFACAAFIWAHAAIHLMIFRTHYWWILLSLPAEVAKVFTAASWPRTAVLVAGVAALLLWSCRRGAGGFRSLTPLAALAACIALWGQWQRGWVGVDLLAAYIGMPTLVAGGLGLALSATQAQRLDLAGRVFGSLVALAFLQVMLAPHATPVPIWEVRRAATIVLPALCLGVAFLAQAAARRWHWSAGALLVCLAIAGQAMPFAQLRLAPYYQDSLRHVRAVAAMLQPDAVLLFDKPLTAWGLGPALWAEYDLPAYVLSRFDALHIAKVLGSLEGRPVYWIGDGRTPPPQIQGVNVTGVGRYQFTLLTPTLDSRTRPGMSNVWNLTATIYRLQPQRR